MCSFGVCESGALADNALASLGILSYILENILDYILHNI